jgi:hypothetical protein
LFGFLFVTVSSRLTGEIGSSSNPISGMTTATLMVTCLIFLALGMVSPRDRVLALSVAGVVCIAASNGGTTAQSLKTGFLVGGTPKLNQYAILIGALISALVIGGTLLAFNAAGTVYSDEPEFLPLVVEKAGDVPVVSGKELEGLDKKEKIGEKEFLVMDATEGQVKVIHLVEPGSGKVFLVKRPVTLTAKERERLEDKETYQGKQYLVFDTRREFFKSKDKDGQNTNDRPELIKVPEGTAPEGRFLVDPDSGRVVYIKDPTIGGRITEHNGVKTTRFPAPKTKIMQIIIDGVLTLKLNWSLVLIGAMIAVTLELCGVSSLAFAVGLYVPIQYSVPIFMGGIIRWAVDTYQASRSAASVEAAGSDPEARAKAEIEAIRKSETSPGVLLASGYIAGGSLAGVVVAFFAFLPASFNRAIDVAPPLGSSHFLHTDKEEIEKTDKSVMEVKEKGAAAEAKAKTDQQKEEIADKTRNAVDGIYRDFWLESNGAAILAVLVFLVLCGILLRMGMRESPDEPSADEHAPPGGAPAGQPDTRIAPD